MGKTIGQHCDDMAEAWKVLADPVSAPEAMTRALASIQESGKQIRAAGKALVDEINELTEENSELSDEVSYNGELTGIGGPIEYRTENPMDSEVMELIGDAMRHGRIQHFSDYLRAYVPDVKAYHD